MDDTSQDLQFALLAAPFPGDAPSGVDLRKDFTPQSLYYRLRDARSEAREIERRAEYDPDVETGVPAQWQTVRTLAVKALTEQTKDLEIAAWLAEAMVRLQGLGGLAATAALIAELVEALWDSDLYPLPDEDGIATRVAPVTGLNGQGGDGTLMQPLRKSVLFNRTDGDPVTYWQYWQSEEVEKIGDPARRKQRAAKVVALEELAKSARAAGGPHFVALRTEVKGALAAWALMGQRLDAHAGAEAPSIGRVREALEAILAVANVYAPPEADTPTDPAGEPEIAGAEMPAASPSQAGAAARAVTRDDMLRELGRIADYFRRTEPHSPLAYTLEEAVRRGRLTWPELLEEVVPDGGARSAILVMLGIRPSPPADGKG